MLLRGGDNLLAEIDKKSQVASSCECGFSFAMIQLDPQPLCPMLRH